MEGFVNEGGLSQVDAVTYHWYPEDGKHTWDPYYATPGKALSLETLRRGESLAAMMKEIVGTGIEVWTGETALAAFGGGALVSQTWAGVMFWADAIGTAARAGQSAIVRQTLCGARYGLLEPARFDLASNPDYRLSLESLIQLILILNEPEQRLQSTQS